MSLDLDAAAAFLGERTQGILIALRKNGHPQPSNIAYALIDGELWISVTETRAKTHNLRRDPRCAVHVTSDDFWRYVVVEAEAQLSATAGSPDDEVCDMLVRYFQAVAGDHDDWDEYRRAMVADRRLIVKVPLTHVYGQLPG